MRSQPELGADRVSLRPPNSPKSGPMGFLDIPGLNIVQTPGGKGWNPAKTVPLCARTDKWRVGQKVTFHPGWCKVRLGRQLLGGLAPMAAHEVRVHTPLFFCF